MAQGPVRWFPRARQRGIRQAATNVPTVPVFLTGFLTSEGLFLARLSAAATVAALPVILPTGLHSNGLSAAFPLGR